MERGSSHVAQRAPDSAVRAMPPASAGRLSAPTNRQADDILVAAILVLFKLYDRVKGPDRTRVGQLLHLLNREHLCLRDLPPAAAYAPRTKGFKAGSGRVNGVMRDRVRLTGNFNAANEIFSVLTPVLKLIR